MKRRDFLKAALMSSGYSAFGGLASGLVLRDAYGYPINGNGRVLANMMLLGGADLRHMFMPPPTTAYGQAFWSARQSVFQIDAGGEWDPALPWDPQTEWTNNYDSVTSNGVTFGFHKKAGWLKQQFDLGNVAIICSAGASTNRRHDHSQSIVNSGDLLVPENQGDVSGWGGNLAQAIALANPADGANVISMASFVSPFCKNQVASAVASDYLIAAPDTRNIALSSGGSTNSTYIARSLQAYYARRGIELSSEEHYNKIAQHEQSIRGFGSAVEAALAGNNRPLELTELYNTSVLASKYLGRQCASLYDSFIASDPMKFRVASMELGGWDSHKNQKNGIERYIQDLFGSDKSFERVSLALDGLDSSLNDNLVYTITTDFGRQLTSNGTAGTDHGRANYIFVIGKPVRGGVYGTMYPNEEISRMEISGEGTGADINGLTSFERVLGEVCEWMQPGAGETVFPGYTQVQQETNVNIESLFAAVVYTVSGNITIASGEPLAGTAISVTGPSTRSTAADASGNHLLLDVVGGNTTILPSHPGFDFQAQVQNLNANSVNDFVATQPVNTQMVTGTILDPLGNPVPNYRMMIGSSSGTLSGALVTNENGRFFVPGPDDSYLLYAPSNPGYSYAQLQGAGNVFFSISGADVDRNYIATPDAWSLVSGSVTTAQGDPVVGMQVLINGSGANVYVVTDANGQYSQALPDGSYVVTPQATTGYQYPLVPGSQNVIVSGDDVTVMDFAAAAGSPVSAPAINAVGLAALGSAIVGAGLRGIHVSEENTEQEE